jgi:predicted DNA-binding protein (MmcQ/YjbR family)
MPLTFDAIRNHCLSLPGDITEDFPFTPKTLVFRVSGKVFLLVDTEDRPLHFNAKCDPERAIELRERYEAVQPGYHMNKKHWNTITVDGSMPSKDVLALIDHSFELVAPKKQPTVRAGHATSKRGAAK